MAITVESPGITSAKEEAAAILFARQPQTSPVTVTPLTNEILQTSQPASPYANFASYRDPEPMPVRPTKVDTTAFRPYKNFDQIQDNEPQVIRPYIDSGDYLTSAVAATSVTTPAPETPIVETPTNTTTTPTTTTKTVVTSALDTELEEDTQYVVKFKNSTIVAATIIAVIFVLLSVLCVVNIVSLVTASAEVNALWEETSALNESLNQKKSDLEQIRKKVDANGSGTTYTVESVTKQASTYTSTADTTVNSSFFDWLCRSLSQLFG